MANITASVTKDERQDHWLLVEGGELLVNATPCLGWRDLDRAKAIPTHRAIRYLLAGHTHSRH